MFPSLVSVLMVFGLMAVHAEPDKTKWTSFVCREKGIYTPNDARSADVKACGESQCNAVCQTLALGLGNEDGSTSLEIYNDFTDAAIPKIHRQVAKAHFADCYEKFGKHIDLTDPQCAIHKSFATCCWGVLPKLKCTYKQP